MIAENFLEKSKKENELWLRGNGARLAWVRTKPFLSTRRFFVCIISEKCNFVLFSWHFFDVTSSMSCLCRCFLPIVECVPARLPPKVLSRQTKRVQRENSQEWQIWEWLKKTKEEILQERPNLFISSLQPRFVICRKMASKSPNIRKKVNFLKEVRMTVY